jgi:membrane protein DedA with SNARE-associated domain
VSIGFGVPALFVGLVVIEAGVPLPVPGDVLMLLVGERAAAHALPLWLAVAGLEVVVIAGTAALFFAVRGPAQGVVARFGPRLGITRERLARASVVVERRGQAAVAVGRATPGLRTLTVLATALSSLPARRAIPLLVLGGSVFIQLHLVLGFYLGPLAESAFKRAEAPALAVLALLVVAAVVFWLIRRGRRAGAQAWTEATCPACLALHLMPTGMRLARD